MSKDISEPLFSLPENEKDEELRRWCVEQVNKHKSGWLISPELKVLIEESETLFQYIRSRPKVKEAEVNQDINETRYFIGFLDDDCFVINEQNRDIWNNPDNKELLLRNPSVFGEKVDMNLLTFSNPKLLFNFNHSNK